MTTKGERETALTEEYLAEIERHLDGQYIIGYDDLPTRRLVAEVRRLRGELTCQAEMYGGVYVHDAKWEPEDLTDVAASGEIRS